MAQIGDGSGGSDLDIGVLKQLPAQGGRADPAACGEEQAGTADLHAGERAGLAGIDCLQETGGIALACQSLLSALFLVVRAQLQDTAGMPAPFALFQFALQQAQAVLIGALNKPRQRRMVG